MQNMVLIREKNYYFVTNKKKNLVGFTFRAIGVESPRGGPFTTLPFIPNVARLVFSSLNTFRLYPNLSSLQEHLVSTTLASVAHLSGILSFLFFTNLQRRTVARAQANV